MQTIEDEEWIIWNSALGVRDFVTIGRIDTVQSVAWLDDPYAMVGPFSLDELTSDGLIRFAACMVMSKQRWNNDREELFRDSMKQRRKAQQEFVEELTRRNRRKMNTNTQTMHEYRLLLDLPLEGVVELAQIKSAYRKAAKKAHPDAGGSEELFRRIKEACDALLDLI